MERLVDTGEAAKLLGLTITTLRRWRTAGAGPRFTKLGTGRSAPVRYRLDWLGEWIELNSSRTYPSPTE
jgi:hypothetical protein